MSADRGSGADDAFDREVGAFLGREASRRSLQRRPDAEVVAAIRAMPGRRRSSALLIAAAAGGLLVLVGAGLAVRQELAPGGGAGPTVAASDPPLALSGVRPCATTDRQTLSDGLAPGLGDGPVRAVLAWDPQAVGVALTETESRWLRIDILWVAESGFSGDALVRAARLDTPGSVSFGDAGDPTPLPRMVLDGSRGEPIGTTGWKLLAAQPLRIARQGCYGIQIDAAGSSTVIQFVTKPVDGAYQLLDQSPLRLQKLPAGAACPVSTASDRVTFVGGALGDGPVYLSPHGRAIWVADPREVGPILARGGRIDGPGELSFDVAGAVPVPELRLPIHSFITSPGEPPGWRQWVSGLTASSAGCYAVQIDTLLRSSTLVFVMP